MDRSGEPNTGHSATLIITRIFDAPRALVYRMWSDKAFMDRWSCPEGFTIVDSGAEFHEGGRWHATMRDADGAEHRLGGSYRSIVPGERLVFTHAWISSDGEPGPETLVSVSFADAGPGTRMEFVQSGFDSQQSRDGHEEGWSSCFSKLGDLLAAMPS